MPRAVPSTAHATSSDASFRIDRRRDTDASVRLVLHGALDLAARDELRAALAAEQRAGMAVIVVLDHLDYLDSTGIGVLLAGLEQARRGGRRFTVTAGVGNARHVLNITGVLDHLCNGAA